MLFPRYILLFTLFIAPHVLLSDDSQARLTSADELLEAGLYNESISAYQEIIASPQIPLQILMPARFHAAQAYFSLEQFQSALPLLENNISAPPPLSPELKALQTDSLFLISLAHKNLQQYASAIETLHKYLILPQSTSLAFYEEAQFELGLIHFLRGHYPEASRQFDLLSLQSTKPNLRNLSQIYTAKITLFKKQYRDAAVILIPLNKELVPQDPLNYEVSYLLGETYFELHDYPKAIGYFQKSIPPHLSILKNCSWHADTLYYLGWCFLKINDDAKAEETFQKLLILGPDEKAYLALGQTYITRAKSLAVPDEYYAKAEALLSQQNLFITNEAQAQALLLRAEAASSYSDRDKFYRQLTLDINSNNPFYGKSWYMRALNDFEYAQIEKGSTAFERAAFGFRKAFELLQNNQPALAGMALKYQSLALAHLNSPRSDLLAFNILDELMNSHPTQWNAMDDPDEILYLHGFYAVRLTANEKAENSLTAAARFPEGKFGDKALHHLGAMYFTGDNYTKAETIYLQLTKDYPFSPLAGEAWFWAACCADKLQQDKSIGYERRRLAFENYPTSPYAAEAYFTLYSYQDYLQGDRNAIKHLQHFSDKFPSSPFLLEAYYLIGLDYKRDRKTPEGKWLRKRNLTEAIDAFQETESLFDAIHPLIPQQKANYYSTVRYRAILERALANLAIAEESQGAKRQIYLEYAEEVFTSLVNSLQSLDGFNSSDPYWGIYEESSFALAQTYLKAQNDPAAEATLSHMIDLYRQAKTSRGYYLSRVWYELAKISMKHQEFSSALKLFKDSADAAKGHQVLSTDQRLDLCIQESLCFSGLNQYDNAILVLSKVVNDDAISSLRLKAMYMRAEIYEQQGRPELARKQLESMAKKGGVWAQKAKEKLENEYGY